VAFFFEFGAGRRACALTAPGILLLAAALLAACSSAGGGVDPGPAGGAILDALPAARPVRGGFVKDLLLTGELRAVRSVAIKSPQTSLFQLRITFMAEEGTFVKQGDPILDFDNSSLAAQARELETQILDARMQIVAKQSELASALKDLEIELAEKEYASERTKVEASVDPEVMSRKEYSERELAYAKATRELEETRRRVSLTQERGRAEVDVLRINLDKLERDLLQAQHHLNLLSNKAPADGLVVYETRMGTTLRFQEGDSCWPGQDVIRLPDLSEMEVVFTVSEVDAPLISPGMPVAVSLDAFPGRELTGTVRHVPSMAVKRTDESKLRVFKVVASLAETWVGEMKPGMSVKGRIVLERLENAPLLARDAVGFDGSRYWAWVAEGGEEADRRPISPIARNALWYLISEEEYILLGGAAGSADRAAVAGVIR
jgi:HlyD family secretion protein